MADNDYNYNQDDRNNGSGGNNNGKSPWPMVIAILLGGALLIFIASRMFSNVGSFFSEEITYNEFLKYLQEDRVEKVVLQDGSQWKIKLRNDNRTYLTQYIPDEDIVPLLKEKGVTFSASASSNILSYLLIYIVPTLIMVLLFIFLMRKMGGSGGIMGVGKSTAKKHSEKNTGITFKDVAGEDEAKESLTEIVDFLHNPKKYTRIGAKLPKGALLVGPPGTGKTLLAKAVAGEAHVPFFSLSGSEFVEMFVGVGASRVRDLFKQAQAEAPCIIFIDEIDAIGKSRDSVYGGVNDEREQTLNQLLAEMDGFDSSKGVMVLGATNRPEVLDKALLRPGRFDRQIIVDRPDLKGREAILKVHAAHVNLTESVDLHEIALATSGAVGADLANMINEAAINAVKNGRVAVIQSDLFEAVETVLVGKEKKDRVMSPEERRIVSYHEVGHALVSALQKDSEPVQKITIVPRTMGALGYVMQTPEEEKYLNSRTELINMITVALAGQAAEQIVFGDVTTGSSNDIEKATAYARAMITQYGMSDYFGLMQLEQTTSQYLEQRKVLNCADSTAARVDEEVRELLAHCYEEAKRLLSENRETLDKIAAFLIERETITGAEFMEIFHKCRDEQAARLIEEKKAEETPEVAALSDTPEQTEEKDPERTDKE